MCRAQFSARPPVVGKRTLRAHFVGVIFCTAKCERRFFAEIGGNPMTHDFSMPPSPLPLACRKCRTPMAREGFDMCRLCRLQKALQSKIAGEARRLRKLRQIRDAEKVYQIFGARPEMETWD